MSDQDYLDKLRAAWPLLNSTPRRSPRTQVLGVGGILAPGETRELVVTPQSAFRARRLVSATTSFQVHPLRVVLNLPGVVMGWFILIIARSWIRLLRAELVPRYTDQVIGEDDPRWVDHEVDYNDDDQPFIRIEQPSRWVDRMGRTLTRWGTRWRTVNHRYRISLMRYLQIVDLRVGDESQLTGPVPAELFMPNSLLAELDLNAYAAGMSIRITVQNTHPRKPCNVSIAILGTTL